MCVAVIGGFGYIGRHLVQQLLVMGYKVLLIDKNESPRLASELKKFDRTGKGLTVVKLTLPDINYRFRDLLLSNGVTTVFNVIGDAGSPSKTIYLTKFIFFYVSRYTRKVTHYIHTTPMEDNIGYEYDKKLKIDCYPENWLATSVIRDANVSTKVAVLRLPEAYGHDMRLTGGKEKHLWGMLEAHRNGYIKSVPVPAEKVQTPDGTPMRDYCSVFDIAGGIIDAYGHIKDARKFDFVACDIGTGVNLSLNQFISAYEETSGFKVTTEPTITTKQRPCLRADAVGGGEMIKWTRISSDKIVSNEVLNEDYRFFEDALLAQEVY